MNLRDLTTRSSMLVGMKALEEESKWNQKWSECARQYGPLLERFACGQRLTKEEAEDARQEILAALVTALPNYDRQRGRFRTWLLGIAYRINVNTLRRRDGAVPLDEFDEPVSPDLEKIWDAEFNRHWLRTALARVRAEHPKVFERNWTFMEELFLRDGKPAEVAARYQVPVKALNKIQDKWWKPFQAMVKAVKAEQGEG